MKSLATGRTAPAQDRDTAGPTTSGPVELRSLTGLRAVAAVWVVLFHFHFTALPGVADASALLGPLVGQGALGVDLFFVLSGFVIAHTYLDAMGGRFSARRTARFVRARAARMWPCYLVVFHLFGAWLLLRTVFGSDGDIAFQAVQPRLTVGEWLQQVVLVQMWDQPFLDGASWVGPTWSISAEWLAYLLFPLTALVFFRLRRLPALVLGVAALVLMSPLVVSFLLVGSPYYPFSWLVRVLCGFSAGVLVLLAVRRLRRTAAVRRAASVVAGTAGAGIVVGLLAGDAAGGGLVGLVTPLFPLLVGALALADGGPARWLSSAPMVHGGRISYALYLVHIPMFEVFWLALRHGAAGSFGGLLAPGTVSAHVAAVLVLVATLPVAHLLYAAVEQPARRWIRAQPRRDDAAPDPAHDDGTVRPVDTERARLDPPTLWVDPATTVRLPQQGRPPEVPRQDVHRGGSDRSLARLHTAREAGHGDDRHGDGLAGNLMAAARLRAGGAVPGTASADRSALARLVRQTSPGTGRPVPQAAEAGTPFEPIPEPSPEPVPEPALRPSSRTGPPDRDEPPHPDGPSPRNGPAGSRIGVGRCGRTRSRHRAHGSAATPIVAAAAASAHRRRRPAHGLPPRDR